MGFRQFVKLWGEEIKLPFWCQTRPETVTEERVKMLKDLGMHSIGVGLESGSPEVREILNRKMSNEQIINAFKIFKELEPDLTFLLDLAPEFAQERVENPDRIERENIEFHTRVRNEYIELARMNPERIFVIDALDSIENISNIIKRTTLDLIKEVNYE